MKSPIFFAHLQFNYFFEQISYDKIQTYANITLLYDYDTSLKPFL